MEEKYGISMNESDEPEEKDFFDHGEFKNKTNNTILLIFI